MYLNTPKNEEECVINEVEAPKRDIDCVSI